MTSFGGLVCAAAVMFPPDDDEEPPRGGLRGNVVPKDWQPRLACTRAGPQPRLIIRAGVQPARSAERRRGRARARSRP